MINTLRLSEWEEEDEFEAEDELEAESLALRTAQLSLRLNLASEGFRTTTGFLEDWLRRSAAGQVGISYNFRKRFCSANHFEIDVPVTGKTVTLKGAEIWGLPFFYIISRSNPKPLLVKIMPRGWHLTKAGRSVRPPRFCRIRP